MLKQAVEVSCMDFKDDRAELFTATGMAEVI